MHADARGGKGRGLHLYAVLVFGMKIELFDAIIYYFKSACVRGAKANKTRSILPRRTNTPLVAPETQRAVL